MYMVTHHQHTNQKTQEEKQIQKLNNCACGKEETGMRKIYVFNMDGVLIDSMEHFKNGVFHIFAVRDRQSEEVWKNLQHTAKHYIHSFKDV